MGALTQDEKDKIRDEGVAQWWKDWFAADYSWDGLTKFPWQGWKVVESKAVYQKYLKEHGLPEGCPNEACQVVSADFHGLPKRTKTRPATLQDYWRDQEGKLEGQKGGKLYTIAHLPDTYEDGSKSWKAKEQHHRWKVLLKLIRDRLMVAKQTSLKNRSLHDKLERVIGSDKRATLEGAILASLPKRLNSENYNNEDEKDSLHLSLNRAAFLNPLNMNGALFGSSTNFQRTLFSRGDTNFGNVKFLHGNTYFNDAMFCGGSTFFGNAHFADGHALFCRTIFSGGPVSFEQCWFRGGDADFSETIFSDGETIFNRSEYPGGNARFNKAIFGGTNTFFEEVRFSGGDAQFRNANFTSGNAIFKHAKFTGGYADFGDSVFTGGYANFSDNKFSGGDASFRNVKFLGGNVYFTSTQFSGGYADFRYSEFSGEKIDFSNTEFSGGYAQFRNSVFSEGNVTFKDAVFTGGTANFYNTKFYGDNVNFSNALFKEKFTFERSVFRESAIFKNIKFPAAKNSHNAFRTAQFCTLADFSRELSETSVPSGESGELYHFPFNAFANANFRGQLLLTQRGEKFAHSEFHCAIQSVKEACTGEDEDRREDRWVALESGCTTLKRAMEDISDKNRAQRYFKFELLARQRRPKTSRVTKFVTTLYGLFADYGGSIGRPLLALFIAWAIFTLGYLWNAWAVEVETAKPWQMLWGAMDFSATHIFRPLFIWSKNAASGDSNWVAQYHNQLSAGGWLTVKVFATTQSFLSITLLFLFGLATKRKFQMS